MIGTEALHGGTDFSRDILPQRETHAVSGNPIAWRERVTRHRHIGSLLGRWGFVAICMLALAILIALYATNAMSPDSFRQSILFLVCSELIIVTFAAISLSASAIAKEREDGSLDLLLTTSITPKTYLRGKVNGLIMHILPMVLVPCVTMIAVGILVLSDPAKAAVPDQLITAANQVSPVIPLALFAPAILAPVVVIPYVSFCMTLGLMWSMRSKGTIGAIVASLLLVLIVTGGLGICMLPTGNLGIVGSVFASLSPMNHVFVTMSSVQVLPAVLHNGVSAANISLAIASVVGGLGWSLISYSLMRSMIASFVPTVRRLAGNL